MSNKQEKIPFDPTIKDWFLIKLIEIVQNHNIGIGITINVSGHLISGTICSGERYFESFGRDFASGFSDPGEAQLISESIAKLGEIYKDPEKLANSPSYIHLEGAKIFTAGQKPIPNNKGVFWRVKIASVDGFSLGTLSCN